MNAVAARSRELTSWDDVRFFLAIHRAGSLSAAAKGLGVTQPTAGRRLSALESSLGIHLFDRTPDGLKITDEGRALLDAATRMERDAEELALRATARDADLEGTVRIATTDLFAASFLVGALMRVRATYPRIAVALVLSGAESDLLRREADLALRFGPSSSRPKPTTLLARKLGEEPFALYGANGYLDRRGVPNDPSDLGDHDVVVYSGPHPATEWCRAAFARSPVALSASSMQIVGAAIAAGHGLGVLPTRAAYLFPSLRRLTPPVAQATAWLLLHPDLKRVPRIRAVADQLVELHRAEPASRD